MVLPVFPVFPVFPCIPGIRIQAAPLITFGGTRQKVSFSLFSAPPVHASGVHLPAHSSLSTKGDQKVSFLVTFWSLLVTFWSLSGHFLVTFDGFRRPGVGRSPDPGDEGARIRVTKPPGSGLLRRPDPGILSNTTWYARIPVYSRVFPCVPGVPSHWDPGYPLGMASARPRGVHPPGSGLKPIPRGAVPPQ